MSHYFRSEAEQATEPDPRQIGTDTLLIILRLFKEIKRRRSPVDPSVAYHTRQVRGITLKVRLARVKRLSWRTWYRRWISGQLSWLIIPEDEHFTIIQNIFQAIKRVVSGNNNPIIVKIHDVTTVNLDDDDIDPILLDRVITESLETYRSKLIPAAKHSIDDLKKGRLLVDSSELEAVVTRTPSCAICLDNFDRHEPMMMMRVTRLPCSHSYHQDCIIHWLEINHVCPLCRYPMPTTDNWPSR
ncbi:PREDICTED: E3 ubiquitin-protein ligase RING1-like [Fragaria vesca subsp. vesca]|uniref:E3 ubiquitin-protein ligase RING1-like n=1 Tax=Fragaria vesca subsp. vesca TaxID=101020 RepID=UPI0002C2FF75|nr:PREDICTED: E3 ubiquitin-protein ligase RING1-like [Fragaria vesca subsp. vesca]